MKRWIRYSIILFDFFSLIRVTDLAQRIELEYKPTVDELLTTVINRDEVEELVKRPVTSCIRETDLHEISPYFTFSGSSILWKWWS